MAWHDTDSIFYILTEKYYYSNQGNYKPLPANLIMGGRRNSPWEVSPLPLGLPLKSWVGSWLMAAPPPQMPPLLSSMPLFTQVMAIPWRNSTPGTNFRDFFKQPLGAQGKRKIVTPNPTMFSFNRSITNFHPSQYNTCDVLMRTQGLSSHWHYRVHCKLSDNYQQSVYFPCLVSDMVFVTSGTCVKCFWARVKFSIVYAKNY